MEVVVDKQIEKGAYGLIEKATVNGDPDHVVKVVSFPSFNLLEPVIMASVVHPNIKSSLQTCIDDENVYIIQTRESHDLSYSTTSNIKPILFGIVDGLAALHSYKICHGDLKSSNILITKGVPKLSDFGLSSLKPCSKRARCTYNYRPMEKLDGSKSWGLPVDIWALGCVFWEVATGHLLFPVQEVIEGDGDGNRAKHINAILDFEAWIKGKTRVKSSNYISPDLTHTPDKDLLDLIKYIMVVDQHYRPDIYSIAKHPYFQGHFLTQPSLRRNVPRSIDQKELIRYKMISKTDNENVLRLYQSVAFYYLSSEKETIESCKSLVNILYEDGTFDRELIELVLHLGMLLL